MKEVGKAIFANADDDSGFTYQATVVLHAGRFWIVATWLRPNGPGAQIPEWLMPLDALPLKGPEAAGSTWAGFSVPKELAGPQAELAAMQRAGAVLNPALANIPGHGPIQ